MGLNETVKACGLVSNNWICLKRDRETPVVRTHARTHARTYAGDGAYATRGPLRTRRFACLPQPMYARLFLLFSLAFSPASRRRVTLFPLDGTWPCHGRARYSRYSRARMIIDREKREEQARRRAVDTRRIKKHGKAYADVFSRRRTVPDLYFVAKRWLKIFKC